jgi:hypothetical protein
MSPARQNSLLDLAAAALALGPELLPIFAVQSLGVRLIGAGFGDRFLVVGAHFSRSWLARRTLRQSGRRAESQDKSAAMTKDFIVASFLTAFPFEF